MREQVKEQLKAYVKTYVSLNKAAKELKHVSIATLSKILRDEDEKITDDMFAKIAKLLVIENEATLIAPTTTYKALSDMYADALAHGKCYAVTASAGAGKTFTAEYFAKNNAHAYVVNCDNDMRKKDFLCALADSMDIDYKGLRCREILDKITSTLIDLPNSLIIFDEVDKLKDDVLYYFITIYNRVRASRAGMIFQASEYLKKRIERNLNLNKMGYAEIYSRMGGKIIALPSISQKDIAALCDLYSVEASEVPRIYNECKGDLRRAENLIHAIKAKKANKAA
ncbi:MAG: ATP-binding protein [Sphingobacteriaceae bacterium]|nr:ATP-binding protein [Sphingobacteriaceae bacterium]